MKFKKISAIVSGVLMVGMTAGIAAAASYPAPFVEEGVADVDIVYGTGAGVSSLDMVQAGNIQTSLGSFVEGDTTTTGGKEFKLYDSDKLHFGDAIDAVMTSDLDDNDMASLADGEYDDGDIDTEYEQTLSLGSVASSLIVDSDLNNEEPTLGYHFDDATVLTYNLEFDDAVNVSEMEGTDLPLFGKEYYVLEAETDKLTLLNSATSTTIHEGETITIGEKQVSIVFIDSDEVVLEIDGETTDKIKEDDSFELEDESYVAVKQVFYNSKDEGISSAEITIGSGKVVLESGQDAEVNEDAIDGLEVTLTGGASLTKIALAWSTDGDEFLTKGDSLTMPVFEEFSLAFNGFDFGSDSEDIAIENGETLVLKMGNFDVDVMYNTTTVQQLGNKDGKLFLNNSEPSTFTYYLTEDDAFLATVMDSDLSDIDQIYYEVQSLNSDPSNKFDLKLNDLTDFNNDIDFTDASNGDDDKEADFTFTIDAVYDDGDSLDTTDHNASVTSYANATHAIEDFAVITLTHGSDNLHLDKVVSKEGLVVELPTTAGAGQVINFYEANEDGDIATTFTTPTFNVTTAWDSDDDLYAKTTSSSGLTMKDEKADDKTVGYTESYHAIKVMEDSDVHSLDITYYPEEVTADLKIISGGVITTSDALGDVLIKDTEVSGSTANNLIIVGGSCINSAAATVLGGAYCGAAFTEATGVGEGQFLIKGMENAIGDKFALVVAGYDAADTVNAAETLIRGIDGEDIDTAMEYKGTSANTAELMVETA